MQSFRFPWLLSNVLDVKSGEPLGGCERSRIVSWQGVKVGLMGLVEREVWPSTAELLSCHCLQLLLMLPPLLPPPPLKRKGLCVCLQHSPCGCCARSGQQRTAAVARRPFVSMRHARMRPRRRQLACLPMLFLQWLLTIPSIEESDIRFLDFCEEGRRLAGELVAQGAELIVALTHMRTPNDLVLAANVPEIQVGLQMCFVFSCRRCLCLDSLRGCNLHRRWCGLQAAAPGLRELPCHLMLVPLLPPCAALPCSSSWEGTITTTRCVCFFLEIRLRMRVSLRGCCTPLLHLSPAPRALTTAAAHCPADISLGAARHAGVQKRHRLSGVLHPARGRARQPAGWVRHGCACLFWVSL